MNRFLLHGHWWNKQFTYKGLEELWKLWIEPLVFWWFFTQDPFITKSGAGSNKSLNELWKDPPCLMGKSTISMAIFNSKLLVDQMVTYDKILYENDVQNRSDRFIKMFKQIDNNIAQLRSAAFCYFLAALFSMKMKQNHSYRINGNSRILKWRYVSTIFQAIFSRDIPWNLGLKNRSHRSTFWDKAMNWDRSRCEVITNWPRYLDSISTYPH